MNPPEEFRSGLEQKVRAEARYGWEKARKQWDRPLPERVLSGRAIGWLYMGFTRAGQRLLVICSGKVGRVE